MPKEKKKKMKINYISSNDMALKKYNFDDGLYHWSDREEEDYSWSNFDHFSYFKNNQPIWLIDYHGNTKIYSININGCLKQVSVDQFLDFFSSSASDETFRWLMFDTDFIIKQSS